MLAGAALAGIGLLFALHVLHLRADFPNYSPWMDYAKYTDEGWYGNAAIEYFIRGNWYVPGDFNPAVALPVWPFLEWLLFHITGVSLIGARALAVALFGGNLLLTWLLVRNQTNRWSALFAAGMAASSAYLYCFSRLAILEPLLIFLMLLSWLLALKLPETARSRRRKALLIAIGFIVCAMVLTKTTAIFVLPASLYLLWWPARKNFRQFIGHSALMLGSAAVPWLAYYFFFVRPRYLLDYRYLFTANAIYAQPTTIGGWLMAFWYAAHGTLWIDRILTISFVALLLLSLIFLRKLWRRPLFVAGCIAIAGYIFFIGYHNNMQPRYYEVIAFPLMIVLALASADFLRSPARFTKLAGTCAVGAGTVAVLLNSSQIIRFATHPEYTFVNAASELTRFIDQHPGRNRLLLSISGNDIGLITGLPTICDDFGTLDLDERIKVYQPGWYAAWNEIDPGNLADLQTQYTLQRVASYHAYDDPDRNELILYRLDPIRKQPASSPAANKTGGQVAQLKVELKN